MKWQKFAVALVVSALFATGSQAQEGESSFRDKALALNNVTGEQAIVGKLRELRKDKDGLKKIISEAKSLVKAKEKDQPFNYTGCFILARAAHLIKDYPDGELFYKLAMEHAFKLKSSRKLAEVLDGLIGLFEASKRYDDALFACEKYLKLSEEDNQDKELSELSPLISEKIVQILCQKKDFDKAMKLTDVLLEKYGDSWYFQYRKAEVYREWGKFDESAKMYETVIEKINDSDNLKDEEKDRYSEQCKYMLSGVYLDQGKLDKSVKLLEELVEAQPKSATFANDLGYILADNDKRLDEAQKLVEKALDLDRADRKKLAKEDNLAPDEDVDNPAYTDSLAWVFFKKKEYTKALDLMEKVVKDDDAQHVEIYDHLAECYKAVGRKADAVKAWEKAITLENQSNRDDARKDAIKKKIAANK